jgi:DNA polymerase-4
VSKIATGEAKPNGEKYINIGLEKSFLAPLSIKKIPGIGDKTYITMRNMGVEKVATIQQMPLEFMQSALGENGTTIWKKANAIDNTPVVPYHEQKSMSNETTFERDTIDMELLKQTILSMVFDLAFQLRKQEKLAGCITLKLRYSDFQTHTFQTRIPYTASDHIFMDAIMKLFQKNYSRRILIRLIGVKLSNLVHGNTQINLFDDTIERINLYHSLDHIRKRFGDKAIMLGASVKSKKKEGDA